MKLFTTTLLAGSLLLASAAASANCVGSDSYKSCYDSSTGNSYTVSSDTQFHALWRHPDLRTPGLVEDQLRAVPSVASRSLSR